MATLSRALAGSAVVAGGSAQASGRTRSVSVAAAPSSSRSAVLRSGLSAGIAARPDAFHVRLRMRAIPADPHAAASPRDPEGAGGAIGGDPIVQQTAGRRSEWPLPADPHAAASPRDPEGAGGAIGGDPIVQQAAERRVDPTWDEKVVTHSSTSGEWAMAAPQRVLTVAYDGSQTSIDALEFVRDYVYREGDRIDCLHVNPFVILPVITPDLGYIDHRGLATPIVQPSENKETIAKIVAEATTSLDREEAPCRYRVITVSEPATATVAETIINVAKKEGANAIFVGSRARAGPDEFARSVEWDPTSGAISRVVFSWNAMEEVFAGSVSKYVLRHCTFCPVVVVHLGKHKSEGNPFEK